jgi:oligopeptide/dipeptide ABC transporter ATP-binding protein
MESLLQVKDLKKYFVTKNGLLHAVDGVSFQIEKGKTMGVVGESGCGKSTLGRVILRLLSSTDGKIIFEGKDITNINRTQFKKIRRDMQMIFQDPYSSINPRMTVSEIIGEPLKIHKTCKNKKEYNQRKRELMDIVGLAGRFENAYPHELDGGRRQRIGIARALALNPKFIVCDEPVSALDVSIQAQILNLLQDIQDTYNLTYIFITHDLSVVKHISDDILVMYLGVVVEKGKTRELFSKQYHPYTKALLSAVPQAKIGAKKKRILLKGEVTSPINIGEGCRFVSRCIYAQERCKLDTPILKEIMPDHFVACHYSETLFS